VIDVVRTVVVTLSICVRRFVSECEDCHQRDFDASDPELHPVEQALKRTIPSLLRTTPLSCKSSTCTVTVTDANVMDGRTWRRNGRSGTCEFRQTSRRRKATALLSSVERSRATARSRASCSWTS
jgi:hypothetical protein